MLLKDVCMGSLSLVVSEFTHHSLPAQAALQPTLNCLLGIDFDGQLECNRA